MRHGFSRMALLGSVGLAFLLTGRPAVAEGTPGATTAVEEVIVTANKRQERQKDVAMSDSVISNAKLEQTQSLDLQDISTHIAGLDLQQGGGSNGVGTRIILRGLNTGGAGATAASVVDDIPLSFSSSLSQGGNFGADFEPWDVNSIEVLRGPQGTLYGATAEGGLIKYVTQAPNPSAYHGGVEVGGLTVDHGRNGADEKGYVNIPIGHTAAIRLSGYNEYLPGWIQNQLAGTTDINAARRYGARGALLWNATPDLVVRLDAMYQDVKRDRGSDQVEVNGSQGGADPFALKNGYVYNSYLPNPSDVRSSLFSAHVDYDFHWAKFQSITSYGQLNTSMSFDTPYYYGAFGPGTTLIDFSGNALQKYNQEFRLSSDPGNTVFGHPFEWQGGIFYTREVGSLPTNYIVTNVPSGTAAALGSVLYAPMVSRYQEGALYADGTYHFSSKFDVELGGRVFTNWLYADSTQDGYFVGLSSPVTAPPVKSRETSATYSAAVRYHLTTDDLVYGRIASGYRPGGPNVMLPNPDSPYPNAYTSDTTTSYEVGFKGDLLDRRVSAEVTAFYVDWSKVQVNEQISIDNGASGADVTVNGADAYTTGVEWDIAWRPLAGLTLGTTGAYDYTNLKTGLPNLAGSAGKPLPYVPRWSGNLNFNYERRLADDYSGFVGGTLFYRGSRDSDFELPGNPYIAPPLTTVLQAYATLELHAGVRTHRVTVEVYGKNLTDVRGITSYTPYGADLDIFHTGSASIIRPRTVGARISADF